MFSTAEDRPWDRPDLLSFEFWASDASLAGFVSLWRWPASSEAWYATTLFRAGEPPVSLCDRFRLRRTLELRGDGLWADHNVEEPFAHWSVGLEAFALALDDPAQDRGDRVPLGYDLDWECDPSVVSACAGDGYEQPARVHGEVLVGVDAYELDGFGWRSHTAIGDASAAGNVRVGDGGTVPGSGERWRHGLRGSRPCWRHADGGVAPGDGVLGRALTVTAAGTWWKMFFADASAPDPAPTIGFVDARLPGA